MDTDLQTIMRTAWESRQKRLSRPTRVDVRGEVAPIERIVHSSLETRTRAFENDSEVRNQGEACGHSEMQRPRLHGSID